MALLGHSVTNRGLITAQLGTVAMGAGDNVSLTFSGNALVKLQVNQSVVNALVANHGLIKADGGMVVMNAGARDTLLASVVNNDGIVQAQTVSNHNGTITLLGGMAAGTVNVGGTLDASAPNGGNGGAIETSAHTVNVADGAVITTKAPYGVNGTWLIDPYDFTIAASGGNITGSTLSADLALASVTIQTATGTSTSTNLYTSTSGSGDINVNDAVSWSANNTLTLSAYRDININAPITASGASGKVVLDYGQGSTNGVIGGTTASYSFGLGPAGFAGQINLQAGSNFSTKLGSSGATTNWTVIDSLGVAGDTGTTTLQGMKNNLSGHYVLGANIDASATATWNAFTTNSGGSAYLGFTPIQTSNTNGGYPANPTPFTGAFDGLGHTISHLYINRPIYPVATATWAAGLFGAVGTNSVVRDVGLVGGSISGGAYTGGALAGSNYGTIAHAYASASVTGLGGGANSGYGGLVGYNLGSITDAYATGSVSGNSYLGGLVGNSLVGKISNAYATGAVSGSGSSFGVGGLVGEMGSGTVSNAYATGAVSGGGGVGGLVGEIYQSSISNAYATGAITATTSFSNKRVGGLVGQVYNSGSNTISNSYWDTTTTGYTIGLGFTGGSTYTLTLVSGLSTAQLAAALPTGFSASTWANGSNRMTPYLLANGAFSTVSGNVILGTDTVAAPNRYGVIQNLTQLQNINSTGPGDNYVLVANVDATATSGWNSGAGFAPIGNATTKFTGTFDGLNHTITGLTINRPSSGNVGLFGFVGTNGVVRNVGLLGVSVTGSFNVGALAGSSFAATVSNAYATGTVSGSSNVGGLVGSNVGTISKAYAAVAVSGTNKVGGLVGYSSEDDVVTGTVSTIVDAYATGSVSGNTNVGGLVGSNAAFSNTITGAYATGAVNGSTDVGGLVGKNGGTVSYGYWDTTTTGQATSAGSASSNGLTTAALSSNLPTGFSSSVWANGGGKTTPYLLANEAFSTVSGHVILGTNTVAAPSYYDVIQNLTQLQNINSTGLSGNYVLGTNLTDSTTTGSGFTPIGNLTSRFTGVFDGLDHTITNLYINRSSTDYVGLFGFVNTGGTVRNIGLVGGSVTGHYAVGALVGENYGGTVSKAYATGTVTGYDLVGDLVGLNSNGTVSSSHATGSVSGTSTSLSDAGGLVGYNSNGTITGSYATGNVTGAGKQVGGLVGISSNGSTITGSYATGSVTGTAYVGGLVGSNDSSTISNAYASGSVNGSGSFNYGVGGLVGYNNNGSTVSNAHATGSVSAIQGLGGLVGSNSASTITGSYATGSVTGKNSGAGGLVGINNNNSTITGSYATGNVSGATQVGGLVGSNSNSNASGNKISDSYATGNVTGTSFQVGGLIGYNYYNSVVSNAYATGNVSGTSQVGGLVGYNSNAISKAYATGAVTGTSAVGGLVGSNNSGATVSNAYATSAVSGTNKVGGLVGANNAATVNNGYWDTTTTGLSSGYGSNAGTITGGGLIDTAMQQQANFTGFDFTNTWVQYNGHTDPLLRYFMTPLTVTASAQSKAYDGTSAVSLNSPVYSVAGAATSGHLFGLSNAYGANAVNAGTYSTSDLWSDQQGYIITQSGVGALAINKAVLTVTANNANKFYDGSAWSGGNGLSYTGLVGGDTAASVLTGSLSYGGTSQGAVHTGSYLIVPSGLTGNANYVLHFVDGVLTIRNALPSSSDESADTYAFSLTDQPPAPPGHIPSPPSSLVASRGHPVPTGNLGSPGLPGLDGVHVVNDGVHLPPDAI